MPHVYIQNERERESLARIRQAAMLKTIYLKMLTVNCCGCWLWRGWCWGLSSKAVRDHYKNCNTKGCYRGGSETISITWLPDIWTTERRRWRCARRLNFLLALFSNVQGDSFCTSSYTQWITFGNVGAAWANYSAHYAEKFGNRNMVQLCGPDFGWQSQNCLGIWVWSRAFSTSLPRLKREHTPLGNIPLGTAINHVLNLQHWRTSRMAWLQRLWQRHLSTLSMGLGICTCCSGGASSKSLSHSTVVGLIFSVVVLFKTGCAECVCVLLP